MHAVYIDMQKAFDKVPHQELIHKLKTQFAVRDKVLEWFRSFLSNRRQRVKIGTAYSDWASVTSGVPQGSVLAPLLFIIYVRDMQENLNGVKVIKFADDTN